MPATADDGLRTRAVTADELDAFFRVLMAAFGEEMSDDTLSVEKLTAEPERTLATFDAEEIVATAGAFTFDMSVPGGQLPTAGVTYVGVRPTHRRRGLLTNLMRRQLDDIHERGEPIAALWASEAAIYGRFGYGLASQLLRIQIDRVDARLRVDLPSHDDVRVRLVPPGDAVGDIERVESGLTPARPGTFGRDKRWVELLVQDPPSHRNGRSSLQCAVASRDGDPVGYVLYRTKPGVLRPEMLPDGEVVVPSMASLDPAATVALLRLLFGIDLMRRVSWWNLPVDTVLPHLLQDPRQARSTLLDGLFLRIVDVPAALAGRRYLSDVDVVIDVVDHLCPWNAGRWQLTSSDGDVTCTPTDRAAGIVLPVESLGAAYLGGTTLATLATAGRITSYDDAALRRLSDAMRAHVAPWCPAMF